MKPLAAGTALIAIAVAQAIIPASAQTQPAPPASVAAVTPPAADEDKPAASRAKGKWLKADARVCLEFPTTLQIIKCSEKYR
jgi:hypothetical protein